MALGDWALIGVIGLLFHSARKSSAEEREKREAIERENQKRRSHPCYFQDGISHEQFQLAVKRASKYMKRITDYSVDGPYITCTVRSQSGSSSWDFYLDFNDYGHITGTFWKTTQNTDSNIPDYMGKNIQKELSKIQSQNFEQSTHSNVQEDDVTDETVNEDDYEPFTEEERANMYADANQFKRKKKIHWKAYLIIAAIIIVGTGFAYLFWQFKKITVVGISSYDAELSQYLDVEDILEEQGFKDIVTVPLGDLDIEEKNKEGIVSKITIGEDDTFYEDDKYKNDDPIVIEYHSVKYIKLGIDSKDAKGSNYEDVISTLESNGFVNVKTEVIYDLITGWLLSDGEVEQVTVDGNEKFSTDSEYMPDAEIIVTYHTFKKNK